MAQSSLPPRGVTLLIRVDKLSSVQDAMCTEDSRLHPSKVCTCSWVPSKFGHVRTWHQEVQWQ